MENTILKQLTGPQVYNLIIYAARYIQSFREHLNTINVFPVKDGDTGNNVCSTFQAIIYHAESHPEVGVTLASIADASMLGARGNSGLIYSQFFNQLADENKQNQILTVKHFVTSINNAANSVIAALAEPVEGTVITLMSVWAKTCKNILEKNHDFNMMIRESLVEIRKTLAKTPDMLAVLRDNDVVDAGAQSFVYFVEGLEKAFDQIDDIVDVKQVEITSQKITEPEEVHHHFNQPPVFQYCTEAFIKPNPNGLDDIKALLKQYGDSQIITGRGERYRLHIHTNEPTKLFEKLATLGNFSAPKVDDMRSQYNILNAESKTKKIALITDSTADLPEAFIKQKNIFQLSIRLFMDDNEYLDKLTLSSEQFYQKFMAAHTWPNSSMPDQRAIKNMLQFLSEQYEQILLLTMSSQMSGTFALCQQTAKNFNNVTVFDTKRNSGAQGLLVMRAQELIEQGQAIKNIVTQLEHEIVTNQLFVAVDNIEAMVRSGRIKKIVGGLANLLNLKPVVSIDKNGKGVLASKVFKIEKAWEKILKLTQQAKSQAKHFQYCILHTDALEAANQFAKKVKDTIGLEPLYITSVSPVITLHAGLGSVAIAWHVKSDEDLI